MGARLGQHFLKGTWAARVLARAAGIRRGDTVLEIGPGKGILTKALLESGAYVIAIEKDESLVAVLEEKFADEISTNKLRLISDDIRNTKPEKFGLKQNGYIVTANIPYYITGEIIRQFLTTTTQPRAMALLIQKEVAKRITSKRESILSLSVKSYGAPRITAKVSRANFSPPPSVDSAVLVIENISRNFFSAKGGSASGGDNIAEKDFFEIVRAGFSSKRKMLAGNLVNKKRTRSVVQAAFSQCKIPEKARAEELALEKWRCLTSVLSENPK